MYMIDFKTMSEDQIKKLLFDATTALKEKSEESEYRIQAALSRLGNIKNQLDSLYREAELIVDKEKSDLVAFNYETPGGTDIRYTHDDGWYASSY